MQPSAAPATRSPAVAALGIGQAALYLVLLAVAVLSTRTGGATATVPVGLALGVVFVAGLALHPRIGPRGRAAWALTLLVGVHLATLVSPAFAWLAFPVWLLLAQLLPLPVVLGAGAVSVTGVILALGAASTATVVGPLVGVVVALGLSRGVLAIEAGAQRSRRLLADVVAAQQEAARLSDAVAEAQREVGVQAERARLGRDIHDTLAQGFSSIVLLARAGLRERDPARHDELLRQIERAALDNLAEARSVVGALAPEGLAGGLATPLAKLADSLAEQTGASVTLDVDPELPPLPTATEVALLRAAQGAVSNVLRHAGAARVAITLSASGDEVRLDVVDDGRGFDPTALAGRPILEGGYGLRSLRDRLSALGGGVVVESEPGGGTAVSLHLPLGDGRRP